jgi:hypothetical protein
MPTLPTPPGSEGVPHFVVSKSRTLSVGDRVLVTVPSWPGLTEADCEIVEQDGVPFFRVTNYSCKGPPGPDKDSAIVARALRIVDPPPDKDEQCRETIASGMAWNRLLNRSPRSLSDRSVVRELRSTVSAIEAAHRSIDQLQGHIKAYALGALSAHITKAALTVLAYLAGVLRANAERIAEGIREAGGRRRDLGKQTAADTAYDLLNEYAGSPPTLTIEGPFYQLASVLYEGAMGHEEVDLQRHCRTAFKRRNALKGRDDETGEPPVGFVISRDAASK